jgi:hypothetical protein
MDENIRPGQAGVDYNTNSSNNTNNSNMNRGGGLYYVDRYSDNDSYNDNFNDMSTKHNDTQYRTSHSSGKNGGNPHVDFKALAKTQHAKGGFPRKGRGLSPAVLATRSHNQPDLDIGVLDLGGDNGEKDGEGMNTNVSGSGEVDSQRMQLISPPPEEMLRRGPGSSAVGVPFIL